MRYYNIEISDPATGKLITQFTSLNSLGQTILGALNIELDIPVFRMAEPAGNAYVKVWGISIKDIGQAFDLNNKNIKVFAGMAKGLPLANPKQSGLILQGVIQQAFGNWQSLEQSLDFVVSVIGGNAKDPKNIVLNWKQGMTLGDAVRSALSVAAPGFEVKISTSADLVLNQDEVGFYQTITQFSAYVKEVSQHILGPKYQGVDIVVKNNVFTVNDGTTQTTTKEIAFTELIGQPTWIEFAKIQFKCPMRADLNPFDFIKLPPGQVTTTAQSYSQYRNGSVFNGSFEIIGVRHVGNFRQPDANSWVTVFDAIVP